jgi:hypothetical protein
MANVLHRGFPSEQAPTNGLASGVVPWANGRFHLRPQRLNCLFGLALRTLSTWQTMAHTANHARTHNMAARRCHQLARIWRRHTQVTFPWPPKHAMLYHAMSCHHRQTSRSARRRATLPMISLPILRRRPHFLQLPFFPCQIKSRRRRHLVQNPQDSPVLRFMRQLPRTPE